MTGGFAGMTSRQSVISHCTSQKSEGGRIAPAALRYRIRCGQVRPCSAQFTLKFELAVAVLPPLLVSARSV